MSVMNVKKRILICFCAFALILCMGSCQKPNADMQTTGDSESKTAAVTDPIATPNPPQTEENFDMDPVTYPLNHSTKGIKILGERCLSSDMQINCDWTGSGLEFDIKHAGGDMTFTASATANCYFRAYVDHTEWKNTDDSVFYTVTTDPTSIVLKDVPAGEHRIKLIKVTGYTLARAQLLDVTFAGLIKETAPTDNNLYIEFVGDSICCAWGTIGERTGAYTDQDGTLAYPLIVSEALNADYSVTALSGQGLLCGNPGMKNGYLYESALRSTEQQYDFARQADVVVINIGTNDYTYRNTQNIDEASFQAAYLEFLQTVAAKNGDDCVIICLYNCMNETFGEAIKQAVKDFGGAAENAYAFRMNRGNSGGAGHPDIAEQAGYAEFLEECVKELLAE